LPHVLVVIPNTLDVVFHYLSPFWVL